LFRHIHVDPQLSRLRDVEKIGFHSSGVARSDQRSDIGVTGSDDSIERSIDLLE